MEAAELEHLSINTYREWRDIFDSNTGYVDGTGPWGGSRAQVYYNYDVDIFNIFLFKYDAPKYRDNFCEIFSNVLLKINSGDKTGLDLLPPVVNEGEYNYTCLLSEIIGRTLREKQHHGLLLGILKFIASDRALMRAVLEFDGFIKFYVSGPVRGDPMVMAGFWKSLLFHNVVNYGSAELLDFVLTRDIAETNGVTAYNYRYYAELLWNNSERFDAIRYIAQKIGPAFLGHGEGVLRQYVIYNDQHIRAYPKRKNVQIIYELMAMCPQGLTIPGRDSVPHIMTRRVFVPHDSMSQIEYNLFCFAVVQNVNLSDIVETLDSYNHTVAWYARQNNREDINDYIREKTIVPFLMGSHPRLGGPQECNLDVFTPELFRMIVENM